MYNLRRNVRRGFVVTRVPFRQTRFIFCLEVLSHANTGHQTNEEIRDKEIRLISESGEQLGIMSSQEALRLAEERNLDLVKISPNAVPPVCKLMDYGKYRFEQTKREKEARKNQRVVEIKEIRMSPSIDVNDFNVKLRNAQKFLADGNRCKITVRFRGREMAHTNIGQDLLLKFAESCGETAVMDKSPKLEGRHMSIFPVAQACEGYQKVSRKGVFCYAEDQDPQRREEAFRSHEERQGQTRPRR